MVTFHCAGSFNCHVHTRRMVCGSYKAACIAYMQLEGDVIIVSSGISGVVDGYIWTLCRVRAVVLDYFISETISDDTMSKRVYSTLAISYYEQWLS